eukprot:1158377-Pelagomonas_calceolata.AAC.8
MLAPGGEIGSWRGKGTKSQCRGACHTHLSCIFCSCHKLKLALLNAGHAAAVCRPFHRQAGEQAMDPGLQLHSTGSTVSGPLLCSGCAGQYQPVHVPGLLLCHLLPGKAANCPVTYKLLRYPAKKWQFLSGRV